MICPFGHTVKLPVVRTHLIGLTFRREATFEKHLPLQTMETSGVNNYCLFSDLYDNEDPSSENEVSNEFTEDPQVSEKARRSLCFSMVQFIEVAFKSTVMCGIVFGLLATLLWWVQLKITGYCVGKWYSIPSGIHRLRLVIDSVTVVAVMFWPLLTISTICPWSVIKKSNALFWCTIACFVDVIDRLCLYVFAHYEARWKSYVGNFIFFVISFTVFYKFARYRQQLSSNSGKNTFILTLKITLQLIFGVLLSLPYSYVFLKMYEHANAPIRAVMACCIIALLYGPKLIIGNVLVNLNGNFDPHESIVFAAGFLVTSTMIMRLIQAGIDQFSYFIIVSLFHGIFNVLDKVTIPLRTRFCNAICRRSNEFITENSIHVHQYIAHQSLISSIAETSSIIMGNAAAYLLFYYYNAAENTGTVYSGWQIFKEMLKRSGSAIAIEWIFNIAALYIQNDRCNIPTVSLWRRDWKFIIMLHLVQIIAVVFYYDYYANVTILGDLAHNSTYLCIGTFMRS